MCDKSLMLKKISEIQFAALELNLYLDTHPNCKRALALHKKYSAAEKQLIAEYEMRYGPLKCSSASENGDCWKWINDPWPWEITMGGCK